GLEGRLVVLSVVSATGDRRRSPVAWSASPVPQSGRVTVPVRRWFPPRFPKAPSRFLGVADDLVALHTTHGHLVVRQRLPVDVLVAGLAHQLLDRELKETHLPLVVGLVLPAVLLEVAQEVHGPGVRADPVEVPRGQAGQDVLRELQLLLHPEAGLLLIGGL